MASVETQEIFDCSMEEFYEIITDYDSYGDFLADVKSCEVIDEEDDFKIVEYEVNVVKTFNYQLKMFENGTDQVTWELHSGDLFKKSNGSWHLEEQDGKTLAKYKIEAEFKVFVPGPVAKMVLNVNLPNMMKAFKKRVAEVHG